MKNCHAFFLLIYAYNFSFSQSIVFRVGECKGKNVGDKIECLIDLERSISDTSSHLDSIAYINYLIGRYCQQEGRYSETLFYSKKAMVLFESIGIENYRLINIYNDLLKSGFKLNDEEVLINIIPKIKSFEPTGQLEHNALELSYDLIAIILRGLGDHHGAIKLLTDFKNSISYKELNEESKAWVNYNLAISYGFTDGDESLLKSNQLLNKAREYNHGVKNSQLKTLIHYQKGINNLKLDFFQNSLENLNVTLNILEKNPNLNKKLYFHTLNAIGWNYIKSGRNLDGQNFLYRLINDHKIDSDKELKSLVYSNIAKSFEKINQDSAIIYYKNSILAGGEILNSLESYTDLVRIHSNNKFQSAKLIKDADKLIDRLILKQNTQKSIIQINENSSELLAKGIILSFNDNNHEELWHYLERIKSLSVIENLRSKQFFFRGIDDDIPERLIVSFIQLKNEFNLTTSELKDFKSYDSYILNIASVEESLVCLTLHPLGLGSTAISVKKKTKEQIKNFLDSIYLKIVLPSHIPPNSTITIIPDEELSQALAERHFSFGALLTDSTDHTSFLEKDYTINYQLSATLMQQLEAKEVNTTGLAAFAPTFNENPDELYAYARGATLDDTISLYHLTHSAEEVDYINDMWNAPEYTVNKENVIDALKNKRIFHFAGHAVTYNDNSDNSFLALSSDVDNLDDKLLLKEIYNLECNNEMVVLSACETGAGEIAKGEGVLSLARGFFYAGAKSVISTLWSVNDESSAVIMKEFYKQLRKGKRKDVALRLAKLHYLDTTDPEYHDPEYWAGFVAMGDMSPIFTPWYKSRWTYGGLGALGLMGLFLVYRRFLPSSV